jgi:hypothetical protein
VKILEAPEQAENKARRQALPPKAAGNQQWNEHLHQGAAYDREAFPAQQAKNRMTGFLEIQVHFVQHR